MENEEERKDTERFWSTFGSWEGDGTAEELAASIRNDRWGVTAVDPLDRV